MSALGKVAHLKKTSHLVPQETIERTAFSQKNRSSTSSIYQGETFVKITKILSKSENPAKELEMLFELVVKTSGATEGYLYFLKDYSPLPVAFFNLDGISTNLKGLSNLEPFEDISWFYHKVYYEQTSLIANNLESEQTSHSCHSLIKKGVLSVLAYPIKSHTTVRGVVVLTSKSSYAFSEHHVNFGRIALGEFLANYILGTQKSGLVEPVPDHQKGLKELIELSASGLIILNESATIVTNENRQLREIFGQSQLKGLDFTKVLGKRFVIEQQALNQIYQVCQSVVGSDDLAFELNKHLLPALLKMKPHSSKEQSYRLIWQPIIDQKDEITGLHVTLTEHILPRDLPTLPAPKADQKRKVTYIQQSSGKIALLDQLISQCLPPDAPLDGELIFMTLHTLKGNAHQVGLTDIAAKAHRLEDLLKVTTDQNQLTFLKKKIQKEYEEFRSFFTLEQEDEAEGLILNLQSDQDFDKLRPYLKPGIQKEAILERFHAKTLSEICTDHITAASEIATALSKKEPQLVFEGHDIFIPSTYHEAIYDVLGHLIRNSLDHGIETPKERQEAGKPEAGQITCHLTSDQGHLKLVFKDDGRGLNLALLAKKNHLNLADHSPSELAELIFKPRSSTKEETTMISGRGVGMSAVKMMVERAGGRIDLEPQNSPGATHCPFEIHLSFPLQKAA